MQEVLDLNIRNPRQPRDSWAGMVWIPRMADKARAARVGTLGEFMYPCPMDKIILGCLKLDAGKFGDLAEKLSDEELSSWFQDHLKNAPENEIEKANQALLTKQPDTPEKWEKFYAIRDELAPDRTDINTWAALIELEENQA
ncbi:MAG: DUF5069 domain-containing protein [Candidatus Nitronauta litoralis]|uniref:DUF5069 domain-containing protein n=1 Tax=Candidatus Nitronauta litoralis TaxID=2705533 RepID=A0A7T0BY68_9BACT|nr:MAG: DUF5069 domain-containing protein [Candidatus Nitronauta litoralis]